MTKPLAGGMVRLAVGAVALFALVACSKADQGTRSGTDSATKLAATAGRGHAEPGTLPKPIDSLSGEELYTFTRGLTFVGMHERHRRCRGRLQCRGPRPKDSTVVQVAAVQSEDSLSAGDLPLTGVIGARALNRGTLPDSVYNTRPGAQFEYYLIITSSGPGVATWRLEELTTTPGARTHQSVGSGSFHPCNHPYRKGARADFKTCAQAAQVENAAFRRAFQQDQESPIWISCALGCCTADPPDGRG